VIVVSAGAANGAVDVVFSRANGASSIVPGALDASGNPVVTQFFQMPEFFLSPDGTTWIMRAVSMQPSTENQMLLLGHGLTGSVFLQKAQPFPGAPAGELVNFPSALTGLPFNASNDFAFGIRTTGNPSVIYKILRYTGGVGATRFQMGDLYVSSAGAVHMGTSIDSVHLRNDGVIGWRDSTSSAETRMPIAVYDEVKYLQSNVDSVTRIDGSGPVGLSSIMGTGDIGDFLTSPDGTRAVVRGKADLDANHSPVGDPDVVVVDGRIMAQVGQPLPGDASIVVTAIDQTYVAANNDWYVRGKYSGGAWATKNGAVIARTGDAVGGDAWAAPFTFSGNLQNSFFGVVGNSHGDWMIIGRTNRANPDTDDVVVVNGQVVLREGDPVPVDLNNDGVLDTAYVVRGVSFSPAFSLTASNTAGLGPDGTVYVLTNLRTDMGVDVSPAQNSPGSALLRISPAAPPACCLNDYNGDGDVGTDADIEAFFACLGGNCCATCPPNADFNCDGDVGTDGDIEAFFRVLAGGSC
jgi:hypothetical protein